MYIWEVCELYEAYLIMKELLLSVLTVKTEGYCFLGWVFFVVWLVYVYIWYLDIRRILYFSRLNMEKVQQRRECFRNFKRTSLRCWFRKRDVECIAEIVIAAKSGERCDMPLHAFTVFCYVPSPIDSKLFFSVLLLTKCTTLILLFVWWQINILFLTLVFGDHIFSCKNY